MLVLIEASLKYSYGCYLIFRSNQTRVHVLSYLRQLEELGLMTSDDISDGVIEGTLLGGEASASLGRLRQTNV